MASLCGVEASQMMDRSNNSYLFLISVVCPAWRSAGYIRAAHWTPIVWTQATRWCILHAIAVIGL